MTDTLRDQLTSPTTIGSIVGGLGTVLTGLGFFWPPLLVAGAIVSGLAKIYVGTKTEDAKPVAQPGLIT